MIQHVIASISLSPLAITSDAIIQHRSACTTRDNWTVIVWQDLHAEILLSSCSCPERTQIWPTWPTHEEHGNGSSRHAMTALWFQAVLVCVFRDIWSGSRHSVACVIGIRAVTIRTGIPFQVGHRAVAALIVWGQVVRVAGRAQDAGLIGGLHVTKMCVSTLACSCVAIVAIILVCWFE